jgi:hypothetical protein
MGRISRFVVLAVLVMGACEGTKAADRFEVPRKLDGGVMIQVDRPAENELASRMVETLKALGYPQAISGVYEYDFLPNKPVFFLGVGRGFEGDRQLVMNRALAILGGTQGPTTPPAPAEHAGDEYLCAPYSHTGVIGTIGTGGLASMSAVCTWADEDGGGFGVWVAGAGVEDTVQRTAEARAATS